MSTDMQHARMCRVVHFPFWMLLICIVVFTVIGVLLYNFFFINKVIPTDETDVKFVVLHWEVDELLRVSGTNALQMPLGNGEKGHAWVF